MESVQTEQKGREDMETPYVILTCPFYGELPEFVKDTSGNVSLACKGCGVVHLSDMVRVGSQNNAQAEMEARRKAIFYWNDEIDISKFAQSGYSAEMNARIKEIIKASRQEISQNA